ncbi:periplasmic heavy metal sensor [Rhizorhapis sp. SPR117]|uniref:periplasmic heavy metal sensor n=1 Tax=Rhizorhapis sp. SPR117 TaxID=2912611 RepID=UPI001F377C2A|nr:periplasmic heavy metal sensor [Rhizorhapis sp. SPR117]
MNNIQRGVLIALVAFAAAMAGVLAGRSLFNTQAPVANELHAFLHQKLDLDSTQTARIEVLEHRFSIRKQALEMELRADNARLAEAIEAEHGYGPQVAAAIDLSHQAMGELQKETLQHIFAMRAVLRADQAARFDQAVVKALTTSEK